MGGNNKMRPAVRKFAEAIEEALVRGDHQKRVGDNRDHLYGCLSDRIHDMRWAQDPERRAELILDATIFLMLLTAPKEEDLALPSREPDEDGDDSWNLASEIVAARPDGQELRILYYQDLIESDINAKEPNGTWEEDADDLPPDLVKRLDLYVAKNRAK